MDKKISECRSEVIEKFINIEWLINVIISQHYFKLVKKSFILDFLYDTHCAFALKKNVFQKICPSFSKFKDLDRLNGIRNIFAHCNQEFFEGNQLPQQGAKGKILDPKKTSEELNLEDLYKEFINKENKLTTELFNTYKNMGGIVK